MLLKSPGGGFLLQEPAQCTDPQRFEEACSLFKAPIQKTQLAGETNEFHARHKNAVSVELM